MVDCDEHVADIGSNGGRCVLSSRFHGSGMHVLLQISDSSRSKISLSILLLLSLLLANV